MRDGIPLFNTPKEAILSLNVAPRIVAQDAKTDQLRDTEIEKLSEMMKWDGRSIGIAKEAVEKYGRCNPLYEEEHWYFYNGYVEHGPKTTGDIKRVVKNMLEY